MSVGSPDIVAKNQKIYKNIKSQFFKSNNIECESTPSGTLTSSINDDQNDYPLI